MIPRENQVKRRKRVVKMVPHGPGGQMLRPAPKIKTKPRTPQARAHGVRVVQHAAQPRKFVPHGPGGQNLRPAPKARVKARTPQAKARGQRVVYQAAEHSRQKEAHLKARRYITQDPIKGLRWSEANAVEALSELRASNPKKYDANLKKQNVPDVVDRALHKHDPLEVGLKNVGKAVAGGLKSGASNLHGSQNNLAAISLPQSLAVKNSTASKQIGRAIENAGREATNIPASIVPATAHILKPSYDHPFDPRAAVKSAKRFGEASISLPKAYVKAYEKHGLKGVEDTFVAHPLATALTVSPIIRGPGLLAGKVATRLGKMPRAAAGELPGTAMKVVRPTSRSYFRARRVSKKPVKEVSNKDIQHRVDAEVALQEDLTRRAQSETHKKVYKARKNVVGKKQARQEASQLATEAQNATRLEQQRKSLERLALLKNPKVRVGGTAKTTLKEARVKEKAARKALTKLPWVHTQLLSKTGHTIADYTRLEDEETRLFTLWEHHKHRAREESAAGNDALARQHKRMAETAYQQLTPIEGQLEKLTRVITPRDLGGVQGVADKTYSDYVNARRERQAIESNPSNMRMVDPGGGAQVFPEATQAMNAAERYNAKHDVTMVPKKVKGGYLVVPKSALERFKAHEANTDIGPGSAAAKAYNNIWRKTALATHFTWPTGNIGEAGLRSGVEKVGPISYVRGYKFGAEMKRVDPKAYEEMVAHTSKGGHMSMQVHVPDETKMNITGYGPLADFARHVQKMRDKPVIRNVANTWDGYTKLVMDHLSGKAESAFQVGMLGKELSRSPLMDGHILKTSKAAIRDAVNGGRETHNMIALGEAVDRMYGQYGKFSPFMRKMIARYTPFIAWTLNSLKWLGIYLPRDHPVLTATAASVQPYVDHWLKDKGLSAFVKGALPSFLQGSIPTKHGGHARFPTRYTPFAVAAGEPEDIASALLPQVSGVQGALQHGINWKGQSLRNPDGTPLDPHQKEIYAALTILEGGIPGLQQVIGPATNYEKGARTPKKLFLKPRPGKDILKSENPFSIVPKKKKKAKKSKGDPDFSTLTP